MKNQFSRPALASDGFLGWIGFDDLREANPCPTSSGAYVVTRTSRSAPCFLDQSCGGWFKDRNPTVPKEHLLANWVEDAEVIYIGKANNLRRRVREYARFGAGHKTGHWGGRLIWQLGDSSKLLVAWKETPLREPATVEAEMLNQFHRAYGAPPFANDPHRLGA